MGMSKIVVLRHAPSPTGGFPPKVQSHFAAHTQANGCFLSVLRTPFNIRLYAAFMQAYAAYKPPIKHGISFYLQKKHPKYLHM